MAAAAPPDDSHQPALPDLPAAIRLRDVRHNNLRGFDLEIAHGQITCITGVSGSGKSSLAFDTLFAEGQRRYVECLSSYARQFLERMDKPRVAEITGILPSVALRQSRGLRSARSTLATLTDAGELFRALFAYASSPDCPNCGAAVVRQPADALADELLQRFAGAKAAITFALPVTSAQVAQTALQALAAAGYHRAFEDGQALPLAEVLHAERIGKPVEILQDRLVLDSAERPRLLDSLAQSLRRGGGVVSAFVQGEPHALRGWRHVGAAGPFQWWRAASTRRCTACATEVGDPSPQLFSPSSAAGACETCNGFGRMADIDWGKVVPDESLSLNKWAIRPWQTDATSDERQELAAFVARAGIDGNTPWRDLPAIARQQILHGEGKGRRGFGGVAAWFKWLETKQYKMHVRVLLARYRAYVPCPACKGARLRAEARAWKLGGLDLPAWSALPVRQVLAKLQDLSIDEASRQAVALPLRDLLRRVRLLDEVGLGYLTFDRPGRTLSGGELQRVQLVAALATGLSQVLYVLDEPSIGLHARDNDRLLRILERLKAAGNTVVVVEHDPALILAADQVVELGPGAGADGGRLLYAGPVAGLEHVQGSATSDWLHGRRQFSPPPAQLAAKPQWLTVRAATGRNLRGQDVQLRLGALNVVCGVSGSGKSTLVDGTLYRHLARQLGQTAEAAEPCQGIDGAHSLATVELVDQDVPQRSARANCATYLGLWDAVRRRLAADPLAVQRGYKDSTFSFNAGDGRCPECEGLGVQTVDLQFLSDVVTTCESCDGRRFRKDVLAVQHRGWNAARFLDATPAELAKVFADDKLLCEPALALCELGLGYLRLGQPLSTLSGGELQRLKIAWHLQRSAKAGGLFIFDEPSTGLHLQDIALLLGALRQLVACGHTVVLVEHHLDLIAAADHLVELGPDGGPDGGHVLYQGEPAGLLELLQSPTAAFLRRHKLQHRYQRTPGLGDGEQLERDPGMVQVRGARVHNLKGFDIDVPRDCLTVITGLSGSGKSSLAFDAIFAEGQRRFLDCLSPFARQYLPPALAPDVDRLNGLLPTLAIAQRTTRGGLRSTVATLTDLMPYLRVLYAKCGDLVCPKCGGQVGAQTAEQIAARIAEDHAGCKRLLVTAPAVRQRKGQHREVIERAAQAGHQWLVVDGALCSVHAVPPLGPKQAHDLDWVAAVLDSRQLQDPSAVRAAVDAALALGDGTAGTRAAGRKPRTWSLARNCQSCGTSVEPPNPRLFSFTSAAGWCPACQGTGIDQPTAKPAKQPDSQSLEELEKAGMPDGGEAIELQAQRILAECKVCGGARLRPEALAVRIRGRNLAEALQDGPAQLQSWLAGMPWPGGQAAVAAPLLAELVAKCAFLSTVGLDYLALGRPAVTLSGGESQRLRLAAQLSSNLRGVLYVLDEPTIGLHAADNQKLLAALQVLKQRGNGLLVVEHDEDTISAADHVIEMGPGGGREGGHIVFQGTVPELLRSGTPTGRALADWAGRRVRPHPRPVPADHPFIELRDVTLHNLRHQHARFARGRLNVVTGVSGSGKSTLVRDVLVAEGAAVVAAALRRDHHPAAHAHLAGIDGFGAVVQVDQAPIGRTPRSCPATFMGIFDALRQTFAALPDAKVAGLTASHFSFNADGGRCPACSGNGSIAVRMAFLPAVDVPCEACGGRRYGAQVLGVSFKGANIAEVLGMSLSEAARHFAAIRAVAGPLQLAEKMGLGYLQLGQPSDTLSGGEAQRLKLVTELAKRRRTETLYVLDEPSTGLHLDDVKKLLAILHELVDRGDTLVVIEHLLDMAVQADWLVDLGPGAGAAGGQVGYCGPPAGIGNAVNQWPTAAALAKLSGAVSVPAAPR